MNEILAAAVTLKHGNLVVLPTETVYGLGADAENESAVARIYLAKGRPSDHPLIVHIHSQNQLSYWAKVVPEYAISLANSYWPGPMTLILERTDAAADFVTGGQDTVGVRVPNHPVALELLRAFLDLGGTGIAAPSANRFGQVSPTTADAVRNELGPYLEKEDVILDGGFSEVGIESTIIDCRGQRPKILRPGAITAEMIELVTDLVLDETESKIRVSGALENHYAPRAKVILDAVPGQGDGFIAFANVATPEGVVRLAAPETIDEFAKRLYESLREADKQSLARVVIWQPTGDGIAIAVRDRLLRASTKS